MKRDRKRNVKDYSKCNEFDMDYCGLFRKNGKLRIDVKRASKVDCGPFDKDFLKEISEIPRSTAYFFPKKKRRDEYMCNIFTGHLSDVREIWQQEIKPIIGKIKTPEEAGDDAFMANIPYGILDHGECEQVRIFENMKRGFEYPFVLKMIYAQFIHYIGSVVELAMIDVMNRAGHDLKRNGRGEITKLLPEKYKMELEDVPNCEHYDRFYCLWNFMKHNSMNAYTMLKEKHPKMIYDNPDKPFLSGKYSLGYIRLEESTIFDLLDGLQKFFDSFCESVFMEDINEARWNYDDYFIREFRIWREGMQNPLGIPEYI